MAINPLAIIEKNINVITLVDKMHPVSRSGYTDITKVPLNIKQKLTIPKGKYKGMIDKDGTLYINNGYFGALSYKPSEYSRTPKTQNKIVKIFYDSSSMLPIKIIPTAILVVGVYFVYKKFIKK